MQRLDVPLISLTHHLVGRVSEFLAEQLALPILAASAGEGALDTGDDERHDGDCV